MKRTKLPARKKPISRSRITNKGRKPPKRGRKKKKKRKPAAIQKDRLDKLWSQIIRHNGVCEKCGVTSATKRLNAHHIIGRSSLFLRWKLENGICLCAYDCHKFGNDSVHRNPAKFSIWMEDTMPDRWTWARDNRWKTGPVDMDEIEEYLKDVLNRL